MLKTLLVAAVLAAFLSAGGASVAATEVPPSDQARRQQQKEELIRLVSEELDVYERKLEALRLKRKLLSEALGADAFVDAQAAAGAAQPADDKKRLEVGIGADGSASIPESRHRAPSSQAGGGGGLTGLLFEAVNSVFGSASGADTAPLPMPHKRSQPGANNRTPNNTVLIALASPSEAFVTASHAGEANATSSFPMWIRSPIDDQSRYGVPLVSTVATVGRRVVTASVTDKRVLVLTTLSINSVGPNESNSTSSAGVSIAASTGDFREATIPSYGLPTALHYLPGGSSNDGSSSNLVKGSFLVGTGDGLLLLYTYSPTVNASTAAVGPSGSTEAVSGSGSLALTRVVYPPKPKLRTADEDEDGSHGSAGGSVSALSAITAISDFGPSAESSPTASSAYTAGTGRVAFALGNAHVRFFTHSLNQAKVEVSRTVCKVKEMLQGVGLVPPPSSSGQTASDNPSADEASSASSNSSSIAISSLSNDPLNPSWLWVGVSNGLVLLLHPNNVLNGGGGGGGFLGTGCPMLRVFKQLHHQPTQQHQPGLPSSYAVSFASSPGLLVAINSKGALFINTSLLHERGYEYDDGDGSGDNSGNENSRAGSHAGSAQVATLLPFSVSVHRDSAGTAAAITSVTAAFHPNYQGLSILYRRLQQQSAQDAFEEELELQTYAVDSLLMGIRSSSGGPYAAGKGPGGRGQQPGGIIGGLIRGIVGWFLGPVLQQQAEPSTSTAPAELVAGSAPSPPDAASPVFGWARLAVLAGGVVVYLVLRRKGKAVERALGTGFNGAGGKRPTSRQVRIKVPGVYQPGDSENDDDIDDGDATGNSDDHDTSGFYNPLRSGSSAGPSMPLGLRIINTFSWLARFAGGRGAIGGALHFLGIEVAGFNSRKGGAGRTLTGQKLARELGLPEDFINGSRLLNKSPSAGHGEDDDNGMAAAGGFGGGGFGEDIDFDPIRAAARAAGMQSGSGLDALRKRRKAPALVRPPEMGALSPRSNNASGLPKGLGQMLQRDVNRAAAAINLNTRASSRFNEDDDYGDDDDGLLGAGSSMDPLGRFSKEKLDSMDAAFERLAARARRKRDRQTQAMLRAKERQQTGHEGGGDDNVEELAAEEDTSDDENGGHHGSGLRPNGHHQDNDDDDEDDGYVAEAASLPYPQQYHHQSTASASSTGPSRWAALAETLAAGAPSPEEPLYGDQAPYQLTPGSAAPQLHSGAGVNASAEDEALAAAAANAALGFSI